MLSVWWLVIVIVTVHAEVPDVTTIYRRNTGFYSRKGNIAVDRSFADTQSCKWHRSGWESKTVSSQDKKTNTIKKGELSPMISLSSEDTFTMTVTPNNQTTHLYFLTDDTGITTSNMLVVQLKPGEWDKDIKTYVCSKSLRETKAMHVQTKSFPGLNEVARKCNERKMNISSQISTTSTSDKDEEYHIKFTPSSQLLVIERVVETVKMSERIFEKKRLQIIDIAFLVIATEVTASMDAYYHIPTHGLVLTQGNGTLKSPIMSVTEASSVLCLSVEVDIKTAVSTLNVTAAFEDGVERNIGQTVADQYQSQRTQGGFTTWTFIDNFQGLEEKHFNIHIDVKTNDFPVYITAIGTCKENVLNTISVINERGQVAIHARTNALGYPFLLHNNTAHGPNVNVVPECNAEECGWIPDESDAWVRRRGDDTAAGLNLLFGSGRLINFLRDSGTPIQDFVDNINLEIDVSGEANKGELNVLFVNKLNETTDAEISTEDDMYVLKLGIDDQDDSEINATMYKCNLSRGSSENEGTTEEIIVLPPSEFHENCVKLVEEIKFSEKWKKSQKNSFSVDFRREIGGETTASFQLKWLSNGISSTMYNWTDKSETIIDVTNYSINTVNLPAKVVSYGIGNSYYSLEKENGNFTTTFSPQSEKICISLDYFIEKDGKTKIELILKTNANPPITLTRVNTAKSFITGSWAHEEYIGTVSNVNQGDNDLITVVLNAKKSSREKLFIQRIADCSRIDSEEIALIAIEQKPFIVVSPGFNIAQKKTPSMSELPSLTCKNGGKFFANEGCDCPAGFNGTECEEGCGANRYGGDCGGLCSDKQQECQGLVLCRPKLGCNCAPGYSGYPICNTPCQVGKTYGASCKQKCGHCVEGTPCDVYTGVCHHGCENGYRRPFCQDKYSYLVSPLSVGKVSTTSAKVHAQLGLYKPFNKPQYYQLQYKLPTDATWMEKKSEKYEGPYKGYSSVGNLENLQPGTIYLVRVVLIDKDKGSYQHEDIPTEKFTTKCNISAEYLEYSMEVRALQDSPNLSVSWQFIQGEQLEWCPVIGYEIHVKSRWQWTVYDVIDQDKYTVTDLLPGQLYQVKMRAVTNQGPMPFSNTITPSVNTKASPLPVLDLTVSNNQIVWDPPRFSNKQLEYKIQYQCLKLLGCPKVSCSDTLTTETSQAHKLTMSDVYSYALYNVSVTAVVKQFPNADVIGQTSSVLYTTDQTETEALPSHSNKRPSNTETSITFYWSPPDDDECKEKLNSMLVGYRVELDSTTTVNTRNTYARFDKLKPNEKYSVKVFVMTSYQSDRLGTYNKKKYILLEAKTSAPTPEPVEELAVYNRSSKMLGVRWKEPMNPYKASKIKSYHLTYQEEQAPDNKEVIIVPLENLCPAYENMFCANIAKLKKNIAYRVTVVAVNEDDKYGKPRTIIAETKESGPTMPRHLKVTKATPTTIEITWGIPLLINGLLRKFNIEVEHINQYADDLQMLAEEVKEEKPTYSYMVSDLRPNSTYTIRVQASTSTGGEVASLDVKTNE